MSIWCAAAIGFITALVVSCFQNVNEWLGIDDGLEVFKLHGIGGTCGGFLTGIFASSSVASLDGLGSTSPGAIDGNGVQVGKQLAEICAITSYFFTVSCILHLILKYIPGLHFRIQDEAEMAGINIDQFFDETVGEWASFETEINGTRKIDGQRRKSSISPSSGSGMRQSTDGRKEDEKVMGATTGPSAGPVRKST